MTLSYPVCKKKKERGEKRRRRKQTHLALESPQHAVMRLRTVSGKHIDKTISLITLVCQNATQRQFPLSQFQHFMSHL